MTKSAYYQAVVIDDEFVGFIQVKTENMNFAEKKIKEKAQKVGVKVYGSVWKTIQIAETS